MRHYVVENDRVTAIEAPFYFRFSEESQLRAFQDENPELCAVGEDFREADVQIDFHLDTSPRSVYVWDWRPGVARRYISGYNDDAHMPDPLWMRSGTREFTCEGESLDDPASWEKIVTDPTTMQKVKFSDMYAKCVHCGSVFMKDDTHAEYCADCEPVEHMCVVCGCIFHAPSDVLCCGEDCYAMLDDGVDVHEYGYKPAAEFYDSHQNGGYHELPDELYMGFELEVDGNAPGIQDEKVAQTIDCHMPGVYCKHDGSLDNGVEIVSHPGTLEYHERHEEEFKRLMGVLGYYGYEDEYYTCGLHVHVNRSFMRGKDHAIAKLVCLSDRFYDELMTFARRPNESQSWCRANYEDEDCENSQDYEDTYGDDDHYFERYRAINLRNSDTIEFRIFHSTMEWYVFIAALQLVDTMVRYACSHSWREVETCSFAQMVASPHRELNTYLSTYMQRFMAA